MIFQILNLSVKELDIWRHFFQGVYKGTDILLIQDIKSKLALNLKFCFHSKILLVQLVSGYNKLIKQVRIIWAFRNKFERDYNYKLPYLKSDRDPLSALLYIELGVSLGGQELFRQLSFIDKDKNRKFDIVSIINPKVSALLQYLQVNEYLVYASDENLGVAVIH